MVLYSNESLYTKQVEENTSVESAMEDDIEDKIAASNRAFFQSEVNLRLNIVHMQLVSDIPG